MTFFKKHWYLVVVSLFTVGLGVLVYITSQQLSTTSQVAPNVPQAQPKAAAPACELAFNIAANTGTPTPTPTPTSTPTPTPTPTGTPTPTPTPNQIVYVNPTATPTPARLASCNASCTVNTDCGNGLVCVNGSCRNPACTDQTSCTCQLAAAPQPTPKIPVSGTGPTVLGASVIGTGLLILLLGLAL